MNGLMKKPARSQTSGRTQLVGLVLCLLAFAGFHALLAGALPAAEHGASPAAASPVKKGPTGPIVAPLVGEPDPIPSRIGLRHYLTVGALVFGLGIMVIVVRRNAIAVLMGIELLMNAAGLNFVAFSKFVAKDVLDGQVVTIFLIVIAAAEAAVALAITLNIYNNLNTVSVDEADSLKG